MDLDRRARLSVVDEISQVLGDKRRVEPYYLTELTRQLYPHQKGRAVRVDRFYQWRTPPVMVDFEPAPVRGPMHCEQKRRWCHAHGIVYIPIFLRERLAATQFEQRLKDETAAMLQGQRDAKDHALAAPIVPEAPDAWDEAAERAKFVEAEVMARLQAIEHRHSRRYIGAVRNRRIEALRADVERELVMKTHDGSLGYELRSRVAASAAR